LNFFKSFFQSFLFSGILKKSQIMDADHAEEYSLKWNSHNSELVAEFGELVRDEIFTDVTIAADEMTFEAHKLILSACSPYFKSLLVAAAKKCAHPVIFLKDVSASHVALLLRYMYSGEILVKKEVKRFFSFLVFTFSIGIKF
jgi:hypothetical protein